MPPPARCVFAWSRETLQAGQWCSACVQTPSHATVARHGAVGLLSGLAAQVWPCVAALPSAAHVHAAFSRRHSFQTVLQRCDAMSRGRRCRSLFFKEEMELSLIGLNAAGKTSLVNVIAVRSVALHET